MSDEQNETLKTKEPFTQKLKALCSRVVTAVKNFDIQKCRVSFVECVDHLQSNGRALAITVICALIFMFLVCLAVFFATVRGPEQVMVPAVEGKLLTEALQEMQVKELYPKIQLRYTDNPGDENKILNQNPSAGAIVKAGTRVMLTVSRGVIIDHVENYVGQMLDDVRMHLQTLFTGSARALIVLADPSYKADQSPAGTILEQDPPEGTEIVHPVTVKLIVSRGPNYEQTKVPSLVGYTIEKMLSQMGQSRIVFDFVSHVAEGDEKPGTVTGQQEFTSQYIENFTHMEVQLALPSGAVDGTVYGIFSENTANYPYPVDMMLEANPEDGERYTIVSFQHTGGVVTIPYAVPRNTELIFSVVDREVKRTVVR